MVGLPRFAARIAPLLLTGCTVLSGLSTLEVSSDDSSPSEQDEVADSGVTRTLDGSFSKDAYTKNAPSSEDAGDPSAPPDASVVDAEARVLPDGGTDAGGPITVTFMKQLAEDATAYYGPFKAKGGTTFDAKTSGSGDPDLFLRFGKAPTALDYDCVSDNDGPNEHCKRTVPANGADVYLVVYAFLACSYTLTVTYTPAQ